MSDVCTCCHELVECILPQRCARPAAKASLQVASALRYQAWHRPGSASGCRRWAIKTTTRKSPKRHGVVRPMARRDHGRWVSNPRWARTASQVTAICHRPLNQASIWSALPLLSVHKNAAAWPCVLPGRVLSSSYRTSPQRRRTGAGRGVYHSETPRTHATSVVCWPYQATRAGCQPGCGAASRCRSERWRAPCCGVGPRVRPDCGAGKA